MVLLEKQNFLPVIATTLALAAIYLYRKTKKENIPKDWKEIGTIQKLYIYPLKSGQKIELKEAECTNCGLKQTGVNGNLRDRFLIVFTEKEHEFRTARNYPKLMLINVSIIKNNHITFDAPTMDPLHFPTPKINMSEKTSITLHDHEEVFTTDCGNEAAVWISKYLLEKDSGLRLGYNDGSYKRDITIANKSLINYYKNLSNSSTGLYADLASVLLVNQKSVDDLNTHLENPCISTNHFRPNVVIDGHSLEPYTEDEWDWIKIGEVIFRNVKECTRCVMTTINPDTGIRSLDREPLKTLKTYRISKGPEKQPIMGIYLEVKKSGLLSIGDKVLISTNKG